MMLLFTECFMTRTKLRTIFTVLSSSLLLLSSCSTRATMNNEGQGNFSEGDQIELRIAGEKKQPSPRWNM